MLVSVAHPAQADAALLLVPAPGKLIPEQRAAAQLPRKRDGFTLAACFLQLLHDEGREIGTGDFGLSETAVTRGSPGARGRFVRECQGLDHGVARERALEERV